MNPEINGQNMAALPLLCASLALGLSLIVLGLLALKVGLRNFAESYSSLPAV